jgi:nitrous oxidase accessory protein
MINQFFRLFIVTGFLIFGLPFIVNAGEFPPVNDLVEQASDGDVIQLENHVYEEDVVIDKAVTIKGGEDTVIKGSQTGDVITLLHEGITLENIKIINSGSVLDDDHAGVKIYSDNNIVAGATIENSLHGIYVEEGKGNTFIDNTIHGNTDLNISRRGNGIHLFHSSDNIIKRNTINKARDGIYFSFAEHNRIEENNISHTRYGLHYMYSDYNEFYHNDFFENVGGAAIMYSDYIILEENRFYDHHDLQSFGVLFQTANDVEMRNNHIHFNQKGIFMDQSNRNILKNNQITNNRIGIDVWSSSINNLFTGNLFSDNNLQYTANGGRDGNTWSQDGIGNAWSDHLFVDFNQDGISDSSYEYVSAYGEVIADQPLGVLFLDSPALVLYENWNRLFYPEGGMIEDPAPIQVTKHSASILIYLFITVFLVGIFWIVQKWWKKGGSKRYDNNS